MNNVDPLGLIISTVEAHTAKWGPLAIATLSTITVATTINNSQSNRVCPPIGAKMVGEMQRILSKAAGPMGSVYSLRARAPGYYPNVRGGTTFLNKGDVWKFGETTNWDGRYSPAEMASLGLRMVREFSGTQVEIKVYEKSKIYGYFFVYGHLPPGNRIFR